MADASTNVNGSWQTGAMPAATLPVPTTNPDTCCSPVCAPVTVAVVGIADAERLARVFKALGDPTRVRLLSLIAATDGGEACICDLTEPVALSQPTVSHHMKQLVDAGLITREQRGKWAYYRVVDEALGSVAEAIAPAARA
jgi:ArsR family transcriptional regulator, arsenate/arsenite/antimonite-responsive transcriptional repressor